MLWRHSNVKVDQSDAHLIKTLPHRFLLKVRAELLVQRVATVVHQVEDLGVWVTTLEVDFRMQGDPAQALCKGRLLYEERTRCFPFQCQGKTEHCRAYQYTVCHNLRC